MRSRSRICSPLVVVVVLLACLAAPARAVDLPLPSVTAAVETPANFDDKAGGKANADDPAIWVHPTAPEASLVIGTLKNAGLAVYALDGRELQRIAPPAAPGPDDQPGRFNNVDLVYGLWTPTGRVDIAVVTDRGRDQLRIYRIDAAHAAAAAPPLVDVTAPDAPFVFAHDQAEVNGQATAYGLATTRVADGAAAFAFVSQRHRTRVATVALWANGDGTIAYRTLGALALPNRFTLPGGAAWSACQSDDGVEAQVEGMVVDERAQILYMAQEKVGIWRLPLWRLFAKPELIDRVREFGVPWERTWDPAEEEYACTLQWDRDPGAGGRHLAADVEGLSIYDAGHGRGYLLASSQGDSTFAVYDRRGDNRYRGGFVVGDGEGIDGAEHCDGAAVVSVPLGRAFPHGLLVVHDGENRPDVLDGKGKPRENTNFKYVPWERVARAVTDYR
jgi:3-phytase